ncbi:MAG: hypothetical protein PHC41_06680 [Lachnospiraceae bacterium]|nr:hypothetical protein [Lachnospiraceae bacterium]
MSDLAATNCGCDCDDRCSGGNSLFGGGDSGCSCIVWILLLSCLCGNGGGLFGGNSCGSSCGCNSGSDNNFIWIILLLACCGGSCGL